MTCQDLEELLGAYALEALTEGERRAADEHLASCPKCTHTLHQLQAIVDIFPFSVPAMDPPPRLGAQILSRIQASKTQELALQQQAARASQRRQSRQRWYVPLLAAVLLMVALLLGSTLAWSLTLNGRVHQLSQQNASLDQQVSHLSPDVTYAIHGLGGVTEATGQAIYYPRQGITVLIVHGLPKLTGTHVYQGWLLQDKQPTSVGLFNVKDGVATLDFLGTLEGYDATAVSMENGPIASNNAPKGPVIALGSFKSV